MENVNTYESKYISIEELPIGCVIYDKIRKESIIIGDLDDINALILSLNKLKDCWYSEID